MRDLLHDRIDEQEEVAERARDIVNSIVSNKLGDALEASGGDVEKALLIIAALVGDKISSLTTESVRKGFDYAKRRGEYVQNSTKA